MTEEIKLVFTPEEKQPTCPRRYATDDERVHMFVLGSATCLCGKQYRRMGGGLLVPGVIIERPND